MPVQLLKDNVFKYSKDTKQKSIYCCQAFTLFQGSFRKIRQLYLTDKSIYVISRKKLKVRIPLNSISKAYIGILSGQFFIVSEKGNLIIDCAQGRHKFIQNIKQLSQNCQIEYIKYTTLDFLFQKHNKLSSKVKLTQYDPNQKKVQLKFFTGQKMNLRQLRKNWQQKSSTGLNKSSLRQKDYELTQVILTDTYWNIFVSVYKQTKKEYTIKVYSKKFIGMQQHLLNYILNQRRHLENLVTMYTPTLVKAFYSQANIYVVCQFFNGYLLQVFKSIKKSKLVNFIAQVVCAIGQIHESGIVYGNISKKGIMITLDGHVFMFNLGLSIEKGKQMIPQDNLKPPEFFQTQKSQFTWDWWNLALLIFQLVQKRPFYQNKDSVQIQKYLKNTSDKLPEWMRMQKWEKYQNLLNLFELLIRKNSRQRLGLKNDYHQILHHKYFQEWLKQHPKSQIMKKNCPPVFKKVTKPEYDQAKAKNIQKQLVEQQDWSEMNSYLKGFEFSRDIQ